MEKFVGHDGFAGELGHTIIRPGGRTHWSTGMKGSLKLMLRLRVS